MASAKSFLRARVSKSPRRRSEPQPLDRTAQGIVFGSPKLTGVQPFITLLACVPFCSFTHRKSLPQLLPLGRRKPAHRYVPVAPQPKISDRTRIHILFRRELTLI